MSQVSPQAQSPALLETANSEAPASPDSRRLLIAALITAAALIAGATLIETMTYALIHVFLLVPLAALAFLPGSPLANAPSLVRRTAYSIPFVLAVVATVFSHFWDNYIASRGVWTFDESTMLGTFASIPFEEYFWFTNHTFLASFVAFSLYSTKSREVPQPLRMLVRVGGPIVCLALCALGISMLSTDKTIYLGIILAYMPPVMAIHFAIGGTILASRPLQWLGGIAIVSLYLIGIDTWAIHRGVWVIGEDFTTGINFGGIKLEQVLIYSTTTVLIVQSIVCLLRGAEVVHRARLDGQDPGEAIREAQRNG